MAISGVGSPLETSHEGCSASARPFYSHQSGNKDRHFG